MILEGKQSRSVLQGALGIAALLLAAGLADSALAQGNTADQPAAPPPSSESQGPERGVLGAIGRWVDESIANVKSGIGAAREGADGLGEQAGEAAKDAATSVVRIPGTGVVTGRQHCMPALNGGPDCLVATRMLCQSKGYGSGRSLDIQSAQKCPARVLLSGRAPVDGECTMETYVTRAVCQ